MKLFVLVARLLLGRLFFGHGTQKLFGWFGGYGLDGTGGFFESLGLRPGRQHAMVAARSSAASATSTATSRPVWGAELVAQARGVVEQAPLAGVRDRELVREAPRSVWRPRAVACAALGDVVAERPAEEVKRWPCGPAPPPGRPSHQRPSAS
jgi:hypothetical protein